MAGGVILKGMGAVSLLLWWGPLALVGAVLAVALGVVFRVGEWVSDLWWQVRHRG